MKKDCRVDLAFIYTPPVANRLLVHADEQGKEYTLSFGELDELTNSIARVLRKFANPEQSSQPLIAVCMKPSHRLPTVLLSIIKAGMAYLPLDVEFPTNRIKHVLQEANPLMVLTEGTGEFFTVIMQRECPNLLTIPRKVYRSLRCLVL